MAGATKIGNHGESSITSRGTEQVEEVLVMRSKIPVVAAALLLALLMARTASAALDAHPPDAQSIAALEQKANAAQPREQCFLYAELVHEMIEFSSAQYAAGEVEKAAETMKHVNLFAQKIHMIMANDEKRLKGAQILLRHTAFRLTELLHATSTEDHPLIEQTLAQLNQIQTETMMQVFRK
jgi:hypothetical protein